MAVWSEVSLSKLSLGFRIDSEFYRQEFTEKDQILDKFTIYSLGKLANVTDGEHGSVNFVPNGIKYLTAENIKSGYVNIDKIRYVDAIVDDRNARARVKTNDILISIKGTLGQIAIAEKWLLPANMNRDVAIVKPTNKIFDSIFIGVFLLSKYGLYQLARESSGGVQQMITLGRLRNIKIPYISPKQQSKIAAYFSQGLLNKERAKHLHTQAQQILEMELEINSLLLEKPIGYETNFNELINSHRLDAQHFKPEYKALLKHIQKGNWTSLRNLRTYNSRGVQPIYVEDGDIPVVNSQHIGRRHLDYDNLQKTTVSLFNASPEAHIQPDDLLIYTTGAYIGTTNVYLSNQQALASNHVNILRLNGSVDPAYMALVLQSKIGQFQTKKHARGSAQAELYPSDIDKFIVPLLPDSKEKEIGNLVRASLRKKQESEQLLEKAKHQVEQLIEEAAAQ